MKQHGFTLIEILITIFVIALFVGMVGLSFQNDPRYKEVEREGKRLKFYLEMASDEAIFQNIDLGFYITKLEIHPYEWVVLKKAEPDDPESKDKWGWREFQTRLVKPFILPELFEQTIKIDGQSLSLNYNLPEKQDEIEPQFFIASSGEQPMAEFEIGIEEFPTTAVVSGEGLGRFGVELVNYEE